MNGQAPETASKFAHPPREPEPYEPRHKEGYLGVITKLRNTKRSGRNVKKVYRPDPVGYKPFINPFLTSHYDYSSEEDENNPNLPKRSRADIKKLEDEYRKFQKITQNTPKFSQKSLFFSKFSVSTRSRTKNA